MPGLENYKPVKQRIHEFRQAHPDWTIRTTLRRDEDHWISETLISDEHGHLIANGWAYEKAQKPFDAEKTETSSVGRALVFAGWTDSLELSQEEKERSEGVQKAQKQGPPSKTLDRGPVTLESLKAQEESGRLRIAQEEAEAANLQPKVEGHLAHGFTKLLMETPVGSAPKGIWADFVAALVAEAARENADIDWRRYTHGKGFNELTTMDLKGLVGDLQSAYAL